MTPSMMGKIHLPTIQVAGSTRLVNTLRFDPVFFSVGFKNPNEEDRNMKSRAFPRLTVMFAILAAFTPFAYAGPPLVCHAIDIGSAKTLPNVELNYRKGSTSYDLKNLAADTLNILDSDSSVLVHMETLRRATIYARQNPQVAKELLVKLRARAGNPDTADSARALAWFDVGYLVEVYRQWFNLGQEANPAVGIDGYAWVKKAISLRGEDPRWSSPLP
jgi:hypothetical protein